MLNLSSEHNAAHETARWAMREGRNCCEAVLLAAGAAWEIDLDNDLLAAAFFFEEGMHSGCTCGAFAGLIMASGVLSSRNGLPRDKQLPIRLRDRFLNEFGSTCCRVILKNRPLQKRLRNRAECTDLAARTAVILVEEWTGKFDGGPGDL